MDKSDLKPYLQSCLRNFPWWQRQEGSEINLGKGFTSPVKKDDDEEEEEEKKRTKNRGFADFHIYL